MKGRRIAAAAMALILLGGVGFLLRDRLLLAAYRAGADRAMAADAMASLPDGLHVAFCGTGSPLPDPARGQPCLAVIAGNRLFLVDAGEGAAARLARMGLPAGRIEAVLLTHFHSDHIDGLGGVALQRWAGAGAPTPLPLIGPVGVGAVAAGVNAAHALDAGYRTAHHGAAIMPPGGFGLSPRAFSPGGDTPVLASGGLTIRAVEVGHDPVRPAVGYRFDYKGRCLTVSGDTVQSPALTRLAEECDLLVHEALQPRLTRILGQAAEAAGNARLAQILADIADYHTTPELAAETAAEAGVKALALTHIVPPLRLWGMEGLFLGDARTRFHGPLWVAADGDLLSLPAAGGMERQRLGDWP